MVGTRLLACLLSAGLITEEARSDLGVFQSASAEHPRSIECTVTSSIEVVSIEDAEYRICLWKARLYPLRVPFFPPFFPPF
jgi:hypothetical protein